jgi:hypothetical protein
MSCYLPYKVCREVFRKWTLGFRISTVEIEMPN